MVPPFLNCSWETYADAYRPERTDPRYTGCWAETNPGSGTFCNVWNDSETGLCEEHREEIVGRGARGAGETR